jgi:hypothetical protein
MGGVKLSLAWGITRIRQFIDPLLTFANDRSVQGALGSAGGAERSGEPNDGREF